jgi:hypothetical protein
VDTLSAMLLCTGALRRQVQSGAGVVGVVNRNWSYGHEAGPAAKEVAREKG